MILTRDEVADLTGYRRPQRQIAKLKTYGVRFFVAADGYPRVLRADLESHTSGKVNQPDFSALGKAG